MSYSSLGWKDKTVLVTGATGMLGRSVIRLLQDADADVSVLVRDASTCPQDCKALVCDITEFRTLSEQLRLSTFDYILHLAAQSQVDEKDPTTTFESNISGTFYLLEAVRIANQSATLIVASTDGAFRSLDSFVTPIAETVDVGPYPASKMCAEILANCYMSSFGLSVGVVRLTNLYGPRDRNTRRLVPGTICAALRNQAPSFRSNLETPINFIYVDDAAAAILFFAEQIADGRTSLRTVTVRNQTSITLGEMVDAILTVLDRPEFREDSARGVDAMSDYSVNVLTEAGEDWGWRPQVSLEEGLRKTISWYEQNFTE